MPDNSESNNSKFPRIAIIWRFPESQMIPTFSEFPEFRYPPKHTNFRDLTYIRKLRSNISEFLTRISETRRTFKRQVSRVRAKFSMIQPTSETRNFRDVPTLPPVWVTCTFRVPQSVKLHKIVQFKDPRVLKNFQGIQGLEISVTWRDPRQINFSKPEGPAGRVIPEEGLAQDYRKIGRVGSAGSPPNIAVIPATLRYRTLSPCVCARAYTCTMCVHIRDSRGRKWNIDEGERNVLRSENSRKEPVLIWGSYCVGDRRGKWYVSATRQTFFREETRPRYLQSRNST